ncbi:MAG: S41 family peptidase [Paludibacter sp.]|nr:S41 family peptidase [Paludibacter sp.]
MKKISILFAVCILTPLIYAQGFSALQQRKLTNALTAISNLYVDSINDKKIVENTLESILKELDPHSSYIPKEEVERVNEPLEGSFEGVGIQFQFLNDTLLVVQTISGCPAAKVGVLPGDRILYIENEFVDGKKLKNSDIFKRLRGKKGTEVNIKVQRGGKSNLIDFKITRDKIPLFSVDATYMIGKEIGYIKVNSFGSSTHDEFIKAFDELKKKGMKSLILSLQGNGGGYLNTAQQLADEFLSRNKLIVYTQGLNQPKSVLEATAIGKFETGKLIVLVDEYSASASEIVSGALQDWDRAIIVGRRSFGKGLVQRQFPLIDGSMMRLTVARYYTPTGRCIQKPYKDGIDKYEHDLINRYNKGELIHADSIHFPDSLKYQTLNLKRTVYGGGGIMPDIFVPLDTAEFTTFHRKLLGLGIINKVCVQYMDKNRAELKKKYPTFEKYKKEFQIDDAFLNALIVEADKEKAIAAKSTKDSVKSQVNAKEKEDVEAKEFEKSKPLIRLQLKSLIARDLWDTNEYYQIMDADNESLLKAVEILQTPGAYEKILK